MLRLLSCSDSCAIGEAPSPGSREHPEGEFRIIFQFYFFGTIIEEAFLTWNRVISYCDVSELKNKAQPSVDTVEDMMIRCWTSARVSSRGATLSKRAQAWTGRYTRGCFQDQSSFEWRVTCDWWLQLFLCLRDCG